MACLNIPKRNKIDRPGLKLASKFLGVDYSHLRRVVIGERHSPELMQKLESYQSNPTAFVQKNAFQKKYLNSPPLTPQTVRNAAMENLTPEFFAILTKLKLEVVVVSFVADRDSKIWNHPRFEEDLDADLIRAQAGHYDSSHYSDNLFLHFFHVKNLAKAMRHLKSSIEDRGLLDISVILHGEAHDKLRVYWPPLATEIATA